MDSQSLLNSRRAVKAQLTRISKWLDENKDNEMKVSAFEIQESRLEKNFEKYEYFQDQIDSLNDDQESTDDRSIVEQQYIATLTTIKECIKTLNHSLSHNSSDIQNDSMTHVSQSKLKLPDVHIPPFSGSNESEWSSFFDLFESLIVKNPTLSDVQKLYYLKGFLRGEALKIIDSLKINNENFTTAMSLLRTRYENKSRILNTLFQDFMNVPSLSKCTSQNLREFVVTCKKNFNSIQNLQLDDRSILEALFTFGYKQKLDYNTKKAFEETRAKDQCIKIDDFFDFIDNRCVILENLTSSDNISVHKRNKVTLHINNNCNRSSSSQGQNMYCLYCKSQNHKIYKCDKFESLNPEDRRRFVQSRKLCLNCFGSKHMVENCSSNATCIHCNRKHHSMIHIPNSPRTSLPPSVQRQIPGRNPTTNFCSDSPSRSENNENSECSQNPSTSQQNVSNSSFSAHSSKYSHVLLATAQAALHTPRNQALQVRILLDPGSQNSFITQNIINKSGYTTYDRNLHISGISGHKVASNKMANVILNSNIDPSKNFHLCCAVVDNITDTLPQTCIQVHKLNIPENIWSNLADPDFASPNNIDILVGADAYYDILSRGIFKLGKGLPTLLKTHLGWIISGNIPSYYISDYIPSHSHSYHVMSTLEEETLDKQLTKFWTIEEVSDTPVLSVENELSKKIFSSTTKILDNGRYQVDIPLRGPLEHHKLGDSFSVAKKRFFSLEKKFEKDPVLGCQYKKFIDEYIALNHAKYVPLSLTNSISEKKYFIPHLSVVREESSTTKLRVVFDASCKTSSGLSLNDITLKGFQVQPDLFDILCRFRLFKFVLTADIVKMYRQIKVNPDHNFLQNILWRDSPTEPIKCIELQTVTYGTNFAPFAATSVLNDIAINNKNFPLASNALLTQTYVDDILAGANSLAELKDLKSQLTFVLSKFGFHLHKWMSNSNIILDEFSESSISEYDINLEKSPCKILGISWNPHTDNFQISTPYKFSRSPVTKRIILSSLAQCFDPMGLVNPVIVSGKVLMQKLWLQKLGWDEKILDSSILNDWKDFVNSLSQLHTLKIPRFVFFEKEIKLFEIHGFSDASTRAYGACIYIRTIYTDHSVSCNLITSKSRVAPLKVLTIPKLELSAMLLLSKLVKRVMDIFGNRFCISSVNLWTDSQVALCWIESHASRWTTFVSNRVSKIQTLTSNFEWRYVKSSDNPSDFLSRGIFNTKIYNFWFLGPKFLQDSNLDLNTFNSFRMIDNPPEERKVILTSTQDVENYWLVIFARFSSFNRLQRSLAYILRFIHNCKSDHDSRLGPLSIDELSSSLEFILKILQKHYFKNEITQLNSGKSPVNKQLLSLKPFIDEKGLLRVGGRLENAQVSFQQKHPVLLPSRDHTVLLMIKFEHVRLGHSGPQNVLSNFRLRYWPLNGLRQVKRIIRSCTNCFRFNAQSSKQIMANLPKDRVTFARPFQKVGVDFGGPFLIKSSHLRKSPVTKCYISIFVCMVTKAIHIELVSSLSTDAFLATFKRFISRRGNPAVIYSDNATNFLGAKNQLKELYDHFQNPHFTQAIQNYLSLNEIQWKFIPPRSPHWGGVWESAVKSAKYHIKRIIGCCQLTFEEFSTVLAQIEAILNSRPLCPLSNDPSDYESLTPGHFLIGSSLTAFPEKNLTQLSQNRLDFWQQCSKIQQMFWRRWSIDYLNRLQNRPKWFIPSENLKENDMVLVKEDDTPPLKWPLARVVETIQGSDGKVRVVKLKTADGEYTRPITKVCLLPKEDL